MRRWKQWIMAFIGLALIVVVLYLALNFIFKDFFVDMMWYDALGYSGLFWFKILYKYLVFGAATLVFFAIIFFNFWIASRYLGATKSEDGPEKVRKAAARLASAFRSGSMKVYTPLSIILAVPLAVPLFQQWESALLYIYGPKAGTRDPFYNIDVSYYLFSLPIYNLLQGRLLITLLLLFASLAILYYLERRMLATEAQPFPKGAKIHMSIIIFLVFLAQAWGYNLERHELLYNTQNEPLFFGPGFTEIWVTLPLIWFSGLSLLATAFFLIRYVNSRKGLIPLVLFIAIFALSHAARNWEFLPNNIDKYIVKPNELTKQSDYISNAVKSTLAAYNLTAVETRDYRRQQTLRSLKDPQFQQNLENIPVWDRELLASVFQQEQGIRPYYTFSGVDVDRYEMDNVLHQVYLAGREITLDKLSSHAQTWVNVHLRYTHGYGVVMVPAAQKGEENPEWYIHEIPPVSEHGFGIKEPSIYFGTMDASYVIAPNDMGELLYPGDSKDVETDYEGTGGVPISSIFKKALFAVYFQNKNILFTTKTNSNSRILFRRNIRERIRKLTPFFRLDDDPYLVVTKSGLFWIQDAYTISDWYPNAAFYEEGFNYVRNSVKIVVDAYNGSVDYYLIDKKDPIAQAYDRMYPGLLKPWDQFPEALRSHVRYPKDMFEIQMKIYSKYHQTDPATFYQDEDHWEFSKFYRQDDLIRMEPYYLTLDFIQPDKPEFILFTPMSPKNRDNLRALAIAGCDGDNYGRLIVYAFPKGRQVYGPSQINALIDQDTEIAQQLTLLNQMGSEVKRGKMIIFPVGQEIVYIQPFYMESAAQIKIPQLKRLIVSQGEVVVMEKSLQEAFERLGQILKARKGSDDTGVHSEEEAAGKDDHGAHGDTHGPAESAHPPAPSHDHPGDSGAAEHDHVEQGHSETMLHNEVGNHDEHVDHSEPTEHHGENHDSEH